MGGIAGASQLCEARSAIPRGTSTYEYAAATAPIPSHVRQFLPLVRVDPGNKNPSEPKVDGEQG